MISIPGRGETFCKPQQEDWHKVTEENVARLAQGFIGIDSRSWRSEVMHIAAQYMAELGINAPDYDPNKPLLISGHQPYPFHSGIYYKYRLIAQQSKYFNPLWISMDTEPCGAYPVKVPSFRESPRIRKLHMLPASSDAVFYADAKSDKEWVVRFVEELFEELSTIPEGRFDFARKFLEERLGSEFKDPPVKMRDLMLLLKREYLQEIAAAVHEVPLSRICETDNFFHLAHYLAANASAVKDYFNASLENYRKTHQLRSPANPFPNLQEEERGIETLLWKVVDGERSPLFVKSNHGNLVIDLGGDIEIDSPGKLKDVCAKSGVRVWPRAVALSLMQRLFLGDLFVHGIGGAKYDQVTDDIIIKLFKITPPTFAVASCTLDVAGLDDPLPALNNMMQQEREMRFHPEEYLEMKGETEEAFDEKERLILEIKQSGADKKKIGARIAELNNFLVRKLEPEREKLKSSISALEEELVRFNVLSDREIPFFFYPPDSLPT